MHLCSLFEIPYKLKYDNEYDQYGGHYAEYQNHSNCGRQIDFETEYAEYECGRSESGNQMKKNKCHYSVIVSLILLLSGKEYKEYP